MQLVQPSKFFSVTIFRTHSIGSIGMRTRANWGYVAILVPLKISMSVQLLWELHALFSEGVYTPLVSQKKYS